MEKTYTYQLNSYREPNDPLTGRSNYYREPHTSSLLTREHSIITDVEGVLFKMIAVDAV